MTDGPLQGIRVVDLSTTLASAFTTTVFADFGAEVVQIEPSGGSRLRSQPGWPCWSRGKKSIVLNLHAPRDLSVARSLLLDADVIVEAFRPGVTDRLGIGYDVLQRENPALVYTSITGFGSHGPYSRLKGYEAIVEAKIGGLNLGRAPGGRAGPYMTSHSGLTLAGGLLAMYGTFVALFERECSGCGQRVDVSLIQAIAGCDMWMSILRHIARTLPDAYAESGEGPLRDPSGVPASWLGFGTMVALSKDGYWIQFGHASQKQFAAFVDSLDFVRNDPTWKLAPDSEDATTRAKFWELTLEAVRSKTFDEWRALFDDNPDLFAERLHCGIEALDHPQMVHDHNTLEVLQPGLGAVREPNVLVKMSATSGSAEGRMPRVDEHGAELRSRPRREKPLSPTEPTSTGPPLRGITVLELATFIAAPFGATMLADMGARVIKVEPIGGDPGRFMLPFPEASGVRVTQGKEAIAVDWTTQSGKEIVYALAARADLVLHSYRGGVAKRLGYDHESLLSINPNLVYHYGQGFGKDGPYAHRPAYAPVIGAASGFVHRNLHDVPEQGELTIDEIKSWATRLSAPLLTNPDSLGAYSVAAAMVLGLLARQRGSGGQWTYTSMLLTMAHVMSDDMIDYAGRGPVPRVDSEGFGFSALYRLYESAGHGWVVLCVTTEREWQRLSGALGSSLDLAGDPRFATALDRARNDGALVETLSRVFSSRSATEWESTMVAADVACVEVVDGPMHAVLLDEGGLAEQIGIATTVDHPLFGRHSRYEALATLSRSTSVTGPGCLKGQQTDAILRELGYSEQRIIELRAASIIA